MTKFVLSLFLTLGVFNLMAQITEEDPLEIIQKCLSNCGLKNDYLFDGYQGVPDDDICNFTLTRVTYTTDAINDSLTTTDMFNFGRLDLENITIKKSESFSTITFYTRDSQPNITHINAAGIEDQRSLFTIRCSNKKNLVALKKAFISMIELCSGYSSFK